MFVIIDMEWMTNTEGHHAPTQISALRVDENWNTVAEFGARIRPRDASFYNWDHVAYNGGTVRDFIGAKNAYVVLSDFCGWLCEDDVLLWWHAEAECLFKRLIGMILGKKTGQKSVAVWKHVSAFLKEQGIPKGSPYELAERCGLAVDASMRHCAQSDAGVLRQLLEKIRYPQQKFLEPLPEKGTEKKIFPLSSQLPFQCDSEAMKIHRKECPLIEGKETKGYACLQRPIGKGYKPCTCCKEAYRQAVKERNADIISRTQYTYVYTPDSTVFHKHTCGLVLHANTILGARKYKTVVQSGRTPCGKCCPTPNDALRPLPLRDPVPQPKPSAPVSMLPKGAVKALKRQKTAVAERYRMLSQDGLSELQRNDAYTLTQPGFSFWAARGYQTFHTHSCPKLQGLSDLKGFKTYRAAVRARLTPCRRCKPTDKLDMKVSIPILSRIRMNESVEDLIALCAGNGYGYTVEKNRFYLETAVGKWKIHTDTSPLKVEHINLVTNPGETRYHQQPRLFLSYLDVYDYIKRHDDKLTQRAEDGLVFLKFVAQEG